MAMNFATKKKDNRNSRDPKELIFSDSELYHKEVFLLNFRIVVVSNSLSISLYLFVCFEVFMEFLFYLLFIKSLQSFMRKKIVVADVALVKDS